VSIEDWNKKPHIVREAARAIDKEALSAMGRKGAEITNRKRELDQDRLEAEKAIAEERAAIEELERAISANEHILTPDGDDPDEPETTP
jgi:hypothetical protein